jgi:hypothetical protein
MPYGNALPMAGGAGFLVLGHLFGLDDIIGVAIIAVLFGIAGFRYGSRIGRARKMIFMLVGAAVVGVAFLAHLGGLNWAMATTAGLTVAVVALYLSSRIVPQERRAVA